MANHSIELNIVVPVRENPPPKPHPQCCEGAKGGPVWWEQEAQAQAATHPHHAGWTAVLNVSIPARMYWLYNPVFCPLCGSKLPEKP